MKKILSMVISIVMLIAAISIPAYAESPNIISFKTVTLTSSDDGITTYANPKDLVYVENDIILTSLVNSNYTVTPTEGRALRIWIKSDNSINVTVRKVGFIGYPKVYSQTFGAGDRDVEAVASCSGKNYIVQISGPAGTTFSMLIYETGG